MSPESSSAWKLHKILPESQWPKRITYAGWGLALLAIAISGLGLLWKLAAVVLAVLLMRYTRRLPVVRSLSIDNTRCTLRLDKSKTLTLSSPYRTTPLVWCVAIHHENRFTGRWVWLYRDQFSNNEWRHLLVLLRWSSTKETK